MRPAAVEAKRNAQTITTFFMMTSLRTLKFYYKGIPLGGQNIFMPKAESRD
jgi:hypothetical protein